MKIEFTLTPIVLVRIGEKLALVTDEDGGRNE